MAKELKLVPLTHPALRQKAAMVKAIPSEIKGLTKEMLAVMKKNRGVGLAAPQLGVPLQLAVMEYLPPKQTAGSEKRKAKSEKEETVPRTVLINPRIVSWSRETKEEEEGCLSVPLIYGPVKRALQIEVEALNLQGQKVRFKASGLFARVVQHEVDHLEGVLFLDRVGDPKKLYSYKK